MSEASHARGRAPFPEIPGYEILGELGRGASGVVYQARQASVDREVALKVMHSEMVRNVRSVKRLQREARIAAKLGHPNLISAIDMGQTAGTWWFAMELVKGPSLAERLEHGGRLSEADALTLFIPLAEALQHASEKGVVHRDVKPANILLERPDFPRLVDLGLARVEDDPMLTRTGATLGTPHYISPEQARDPVLADIRSDIWSLGATLFHVVCGQPPFSGTSAAEILSGVLYGPIPDPAELRPELSKGLALVLRKCLSRDPDRRYFVPRELKEDLERVKAHKAPAIRRSALEPLDPSRSRKRELVGAGTIGGLIIIGLLIGIWQPWKGAEPVPTVDPVQQEVIPWGPLVRWTADLRADRLLLADAFGELNELGERVPAAHRGELDQARAILNERLEQTLASFWSGVESEFESLLTENEYAALDSFLESGLQDRLREETGFRGNALPRLRYQAQFNRKRDGYLARLDEDRAEKLDTGVRVAGNYVRNALLPGVNSDQRSGRWMEAREALTIDLDALCVLAKCDLRGLDPVLVRQRLGALRADLDTRAGMLESAWRKLDAGELTDKVSAYADSAAEALRDDKRGGVLANYESAFDDLLKSKNLDRVRLAMAPEHVALDHFHQRRLELQELEDELAQARGEARLVVLEAEAQPLYEGRDYEGAIVFWQRQLEDEGLAVVADTLTIRVEEAQELLAFLKAAADGLRKLEGREVELRKGSIVSEGRVELNGDPWERGFRLVISRNTRPFYLLRPTTDLRGETLGPEGVERLAIEGADLASNIGLQLQRAIFHFREGNLERADELLQSDLLTGGDLLQYDLGQRIPQLLGDKKTHDARRKEFAEAEVERLTDREQPAVDARQRVLEIGRLLRNYGDVLSVRNKAILRQTRSSLDQDLPPATPADFRRVYGTEEVTFPEYGKVRFGFHFSAVEVGAWSRGDWHFDGDESWTCSPVDGLKELAGSPAPTLALGDPLLVDSGVVEIHLRLYQPEGSPPELFAITALGFHVALVGPHNERAPQVLSASSTLAEVAARAREGDGEDFEGLTAGMEHTIYLRLSRGSGKIVVVVDDVVIDTSYHSPPKNIDEPVELSFRSFEPLRVMQISVTGDRR